MVNFGMAPMAKANQVPGFIRPVLDPGDDVVDRQFPLLVRAAAKTAMVIIPCPYEIGQGFPAAFAAPCQDFGGSAAFPVIMSWPAIKGSQALHTAKGTAFTLCPVFKPLVCLPSFTAVFAGINGLLPSSLISSTDMFPCFRGSSDPSSGFRNMFGMLGSFRLTLQCFRNRCTMAWRKLLAAIPSGELFPFGGLGAQTAFSRSLPKPRQPLGSELRRFADAPYRALLATRCAFTNRFTTVQTNFHESPPIAIWDGKPHLNNGKACEGNPRQVERFSLNGRRDRAVRHLSEMMRRSELQRNEAAEASRND